MTITQTNQPKGTANMLLASKNFYMTFTLGGITYHAQSLIVGPDYTEADAAGAFTETSVLDLPVYDADRRKLEAMLEEADIGVTIEQVEAGIASTRAARAAASAQAEEGTEGTQGPGGDGGAVTPDRPPR